VLREYSDAGSPDNYLVNGNGLRQIKGPLFAHRTTLGSSDFLGSAESNDLFLIGQGATAIARTIPTNPVSGLATALGELKRDGIPDSIGSGLLFGQMKRARAAGSDYLNVEFGWKPMLNDLLSLAHATREAEKILSQYERDSGKNIRRRYTFPADHSVTTSTQTGQYPRPTLAGQMFPNGAGTKVTTTTVQRDRWFSGCYTYYLTAGNTVREKILRASQEANKLYGTRLNPEVLWNLAPWSWAVDWGANVGEVMTNVSAFTNDGLVMRHGYIMEKSISTVSYDLRMPGVGNAGPQSFNQTLTTTVKKRLKATPYGFGLDFGGFTTRQWAIMGALGLSKAPGRMR
jgi:hypothetical protein